MPKSNVMKTAVLNFLLRNQSVTQPIQPYVALFVTDPTDANTGTEVSYEGYERQSVTFGNPQLSGGTSIVQNSSQVAFPMAPVSSGTVAYVALMTAKNGGDLIYHGPMNANYVLNQGVQPIIEVGSLRVTEK